MRVVLGEFYAKTSSLYANRRITLWIKPCRAPQNLGGNLVLLQGDAWVIERMLREVAKQLAQRLGGMKAMTFCKSIYLLEALLPTEDEGMCYGHITGK